MSAARTGFRSRCCWLSGAVDRGSGFGGVLSVSLWMLEVHCHTAKCKHSYYSPAPPPPHHALPLMANRLTLSFLQSLEAIFVPNQLLLSGLSRVESVSIYGVLTGMALPFVLFPSAITNSLAVVLLPQSRRRRRRISRTKSNTPSPWRSDTACTWEFSASGSSPASVQHWAKPFTTTPMPDVSSRFYPGSARFSTSPLPWEVF